MYVFVFVCVCACVRMRACVFETMCVHVWMLGSFLDWIILCLTVFETGLLTDLTRLIGQQATGILHLPPRHKSQHPACTWALGIQRQTFMFAQQALHRLSHPACSSLHFCSKTQMHCIFMFLYPFIAIEESSRNWE